MLPPNAREFEIAIRSIAPTPQTVTFVAANTVLDTVTLRDQSWVTVRRSLPPPGHPATNWLELRVDPPWRPRGEARMLGVQTRDLKWRPGPRPPTRTHAVRDGHRLSRLRDGIGPVLLVVLPLCLFGPFTIFSGNQQEFSAPFWVLIRPVLLAGAGVAAALIAVGFVLPQRLFRMFVALLFGVGLALWVQGNFLVAEYGAFTGAPIDWSIESWRNPYEIALWIAVPVLAVAATKYIFPIAPFASATLVALQTAALVSTAVARRLSHGDLGRAVRRDVRAVHDEERHPSRAGWFSVRRVRRDSRGGPEHARPAPVRRRVLREPRRRVSDDHREHTGDVDRKGVSQRQTAAALYPRHPEGRFAVHVASSGRLSRRQRDRHASRQRVGHQLSSHPSTCT